jgi:hypothetical protein
MNAEHYGLISWLNCTLENVHSQVPNASVTTMLALLLILVGVALGQTQTDQTQPRQTPNVPPAPVTTAHIPYEFWIEGARLPAGDYTISRVMDTVVLFRNLQTKAEADAYLTPTETQKVSANDEKVVFIVRDGQHYLREVWNSDGRQVISSELDIPLQATDAKSQVPLIGQSNAQQVAPAQPSPDSGKN